MIGKGTAASVLGALNRWDKFSSETIDRLTEVGVKEDTLQEMILTLIETCEQYHRSLDDIESFCNGRIETGVNTPAYKDVRVLVRQHKKTIEQKLKGEMT